MRLLAILFVVFGSVAGCSLLYHLDQIGGTDMACSGSSDCAPDMLGHRDSGADMRPQCVDSSTCPASAPVCATGVCSACSPSGASTECASYHSGSTPPAPLCGPAGDCVQCLAASDCAATNQACDLATNTCGACVHNADCSSGACKAGGVCASAGEVAYVNNNATANCSDSAHTSTPSAPYCKIADATSASPILPYVVIAPSATTYDAVVLNATSTAIGPLSLIGPGHNAATTAKITPTTGPPISVATSGNPVTLTVDGLELIGPGGGTPAAGAKCQVVASGTPTLTILNSYIHGSGAYGVDSTSCTLTLDANIISQNTGGGVSINGGAIAVTNNLIVSNGLSGLGVLFQGAVTGTWSFNTVAANKRTGTNAAAFNCSLATSVPPIQASIVWGNDKDGTGSSVGTGCSFSFTDIDDTTTPAGNNIKQDPMLTTGTLPSTGDRIPASSPCLNFVTAASGLSGALPKDDVDGNTRPRAMTGGYDCGAAQAQ